MADRSINPKFTREDLALDGNAGTIARAWFFDPPPPAGTPGQVRVLVGGSWVPKDKLVLVGGIWTAKPMYVYKAGSFQLTTP